jgi:hypothetical protein
MNEKYHGNGAQRYSKNEAVYWVEWKQEINDG